MRFISSDLIKHQIYVREWRASERPRREEEEERRRKHTENRQETS